MSKTKDMHIIQFNILPLDLVVVWVPDSEEDWWKVSQRDKLDGHRPPKS